ncbi:intracellular protein transport protein [Ophiostoma piceae UAMH 11346]|uniref:Intracellular protein transport protein n=1 Tax=Ophiostoma piceae (strain UAMH 11346) TaxID=1262450 RepID=S3C1H0_OPHP1|nr:intracellular protein transport protein [Ophiostoma piceae UAMH 11346]
MARDSQSGAASGLGGSNIRVAVRWYEQTVFSGDELRCRITFSNVAPKPQPPSPLPSQNQQLQQHQHQHQHLKPSYPPSSSATRRQIARIPSGSHLNSPSSAVSSPANLAPPPARRHHRASHSISGPVQTTGHLSKSPSSSSLTGAASSPSASAAAHRRSESIPWSPNNASESGNDGTAGGSTTSNAGTNGRPPGAGHSHRRSLSIVSISADSQASLPGGSPQLPSGPAMSQHRPARGHSRASSLQIGRGSTSFFSGPRSATNPSRPFASQPSPLFNSSFPNAERGGNISGLRGRLTGSSTMPNTPSVGGMTRSPRSPSEGFPDFKFPAAPAPADGLLSTSPTATTPDEKPLPALPNISNNNAGAQPAQVPTIYEGPVVPAAEARILSTTSIAGTPRSSGEFYSVSNHSTETLASEYVAQQPPHTSASRSHQRSSLPPPPHMRQKSSQHLLSPPMHQQPLAGPGHSQQQQQAHLQSQTPQQRHHHQSLSHRARTAAAVAVAPETLMMGYAHVQGSFTLDGSLVDLNPFEQVKRKAVVGGQGGGVIGLDPMNNNINSGGGNGKRDSMGLLRGFGWGSLASSLGDLLGGGDLSTIKEMRDIASSKAVPLLSTPQSVLFVDLRLAPGESKTYEYTFQLPKGLPPTHRGKVMKISYGLVIGTQRPGTAKEQRVKSIEIPFRVLGSVNSYGEILGHDLMTPYILKQDRAVVQTLSEKERSRPWTTEAASSSAPPHHQQQEVTRRRRSSTAATISASSMNEFTNYVDELLRQQDEQQQIQQQRISESEDSKRSGLLSPTATLSGSRRASAASSIFWSGGGGPGRPILSLSSREAIDLAILRSNVADNHQDGNGGVSNNRFDIARNGRRVGTVMLARPAYRLGETVTMVVDFSTADPSMRCYAVHAALETTERVVDNALALRSEASIQRVTRKVYASLSEATLYARRFVFTATIPASATPEFVTTGVNLEWKIKVEFVVPGETPMNVNLNTNARAPPRGVGSHSGDYDRDPEHHNSNNNNDDDDDDDVDDSGYDDGEEDDDPTDTGGNSRLPPPLMEEAVRDERGGLILMAAETVRCESFEVAVPLRLVVLLCRAVVKRRLNKLPSSLPTKTPSDIAPRLDGL